MWTTIPLSSLLSSLVLFIPLFTSPFTYPLSSYHLLSFCPIFCASPVLSSPLVSHFATDESLLLLLK